MDAAIKLGRHAQRYTVVSYHDMGEIQSCTGVHSDGSLASLCS